MAVIQLVSGSAPLEAPLLVAGRWGQGVKSAAIHTPYSGELIAQVQEAGPRGVERALQGAEAAFSTLAAQPLYRRAELLRRVAELVAAQRDDFARTIALESGKPIKLALAEVERAVLTLQVCAEEALRMDGELQRLDLSPGFDGRVGILSRFPIGPVLGITPFNFPLNLVVHKLGPALAAGCPIVLKPAPQAPLSALKLAELVLEAGLPPEAISVLPCSDPQVLETLVQDPRTKVVSFTGSASVGWAIKAKLPRKKVLLELGGNAGVIVHEDADLDLAARRCASGGFSYAGQTCISVQRIYVQRSIWDSFVQRLLAHTRDLPVGNPLEARTVIGPLISSAAADRAEQWIDEALAGGAHALLRGRRLGARLLEPTVLAGVNPGMSVCSEEAFAPVVALMPYDEFDQALRELNDSPYGLQAGVFTNDMRRIWQAYRTLEVGAVMINEVPTFRVDAMPYGGVKDSGIGREGPRYAIQELTEPRLLVMPT